MNRIELGDFHALEDYRGSLWRFGDGADGALTSAEYGAREAEEFCTSRVRHWEAEVAAAEEAVCRAEQQLAECRRDAWLAEDPPDCSGYEAELEQAQGRWARAREALATTRNWQARVQAAAQTCYAAARGLRPMLYRDVPSAAHRLNEQINLMQAYLGDEVPSAGDPPALPPGRDPIGSKGVGESTSDFPLAAVGGLAAVVAAGAAGALLDRVAGGDRSEAAGAAGMAVSASSVTNAPRPVAAASGAPPTASPNPSVASRSIAGSVGLSRATPDTAAKSAAWMNLGVQDVPLDSIDVGDSPVHGSDDYRKVSEAEMRAGLERFNKVVRSNVAKGRGADYFRDLDASMGLSYPDGYLRLYEAFYGGDAIRLNRVGERYEVVNGYHRLRLARLLGWHTIPAHVTARDGA